MANDPVISIIIVSFNNRDLLARCLASVPAAVRPVPSETIVVDNHSADGTPEMVRREFPDVRLLAWPQNVGFAAGNNRGLAEAKGRILVFLNPDTEAAPGSIARLAAELDGDEGVGLAGPRLVNPDGSLQPSCRGFPTFVVSVIVLAKLYRAFRFLPAVARYDCRGMDYGRSQDVDQIMGACMAMPRRVLDRVGRFDERFWMWFEEVDLCLRVKQAGWRVRYCADAVVMHRLSQSAVLLHSVFLQRMYARSLVAYFAKHRSAAHAAALRAVSWVGIGAALVVQGGRRLLHPTGSRYRITARHAGAPEGRR